MDTAWISFTSDYGLDDPFVAACVGVIARIAPSARVVHVTHTVPPQDVRRGAAVLADTVGHLPRGVHLAVVDPGVGTARRPVVVVAREGLLVGPDNGLVLPAADALGGVRAAYALSEPAYRLPSVSATFHGRDVFAPAAAHLATGVPAELLGPAVQPADLVRLADRTTLTEPGRLSTEVRSVDRFGNIQLTAAAADLGRCGIHPGAAARVRLADRTAAATIGRTFADAEPGAVVVYVDSAGHVAVAVNGGSAVRLAGAGADAEPLRTPDWPVAILADPT